MSDYFDETDNLIPDDNEKIKESNLVILSEILPDNLAIIPISHHAIFPGIMITLSFNGKKFINTLQKIYETKHQLMGLVLIKKLNKQNIWESEFYDVGTVVKLIKFNQPIDNTVLVIVQGLNRFTRSRKILPYPNMLWQVKYYYEPFSKPSDEQKAYILSIMKALKILLNLNPMFQEQLKMFISQISYDNPSQLLDIVASMLNAESDRLQVILEAFDLIKRSEKILILLHEEIELTHLQENIQKQIEDKISTQQKEFFLREQLKVIKKELGLEKDESAAELEKFVKKLEGLHLSKEAAKVIDEELEKLGMLSPSSPEYQVTRSYLNVLTELPWGIFSQDQLNIKIVRKILNEDHYGLQDVKTAILQFISTIIKKGTVAGSILCLVGPPGVGKTSIGQSIARALNRKFYRFSLGGMRDEAEIKGHRRTYIGAMPGKIIQSLKRTETANPVIMLDEIDKLGKSFMGDPASALLEVLDPEQNRDFLDHYLDVRFDLSKVLFITTANQLDTIPRPLLDRMELIKLSGYILQEKVEIAQRFLIPKQMDQHGLKRKELTITKPALKKIVTEYAREAGVRNLENQIKKIMRQVTLMQAENENVPKVSINQKNLYEYLGKPIYTTEKLYKKKISGVTLGLAWTAMGGTTLYIEASAIRSRSAGFKQTGQLGNVMKESSEIAYSYIRSQLGKEEKYAKYFSEHILHLHVPAGATPKDGPSAGITMALAIFSLVMNKPVRKGLAMTGELTLTGKVLPIGGIREKAIAARRVGIYELIIPKDNQGDYEELPDFIREGLTVHFVDYFEDVLKTAYR